MKYFIIAGEASGDMHAANLVRGLKDCDAAAEIRCYGGSAMASAGAEVLSDYRDTSVMGFVEVIGKLGKILPRIRTCKKDILAFAPDAVILVDYPGFNLRMARFARRKGFKVFYYIPPKLWARGEYRIRTLRRYVDRVYAIFPFEVKYLRSKGLDVTYFGNPLVDSIEDFSETEAREKLIALFPGSRQPEIKFLMPRYAALEKLLNADHRFSGYGLVIAAAPSTSTEDIAGYLPPDSKIRIVSGDNYALMHRASAAVVCSGTASLEAALSGLPQVVCYGFNAITYSIAKLVVKVKYISLANLILDKLIFKELIQDKVSPEAMAANLAELAFDTQVRAGMLSDYRNLRTVLGSEGASARIARDMMGRMSQK